MHTVTVLTSRYLFFDGFKQPDPAVGQTWYLSQSGTSVIVVGKKFSKVVYPESERVWKMDVKGIGIFAPTAADIMRELPGWNLTYATEIGWHVWWDDGTEQEYCEPLVFTHENPAEAAAMAWFYEHEKKTTK